MEVGVTPMEDILFAAWTAQNSPSEFGRLASTATRRPELEHLGRWFDRGTLQAEVPHPQPTPSGLLELASWCVHGTDTLMYLPPELRQQRISAAALRFGLSPLLLINLIATAPSLARAS